MLCSGSYSKFVFKSYNDLACFLVFMKFLYGMCGVGELGMFIHKHLEASISSNLLPLNRVFHLT